MIICGRKFLGILRLYERQLLEMDFDEVVQFLTHLPDSLSGSELFHNIEPFMRTYASNGESSKSKRRFLQVYFYNISLMAFLKKIIL